MNKRMSRKRAREQHSVLVGSMQPARANMHRTVSLVELGGRWLVAEGEDHDPEATDEHQNDGSTAVCRPSSSACEFIGTTRVVFQDCRHSFGGFGLSIRGVGSDGRIRQEAISTQTTTVAPDVTSKRQKNATLEGDDSVGSVFSSKSGETGAVSRRHAVRDVPRCSTGGWGEGRPLYLHVWPLGFGRKTSR